MQSLDNWLALQVNNKKSNGMSELQIKLIITPKSLRHCRCTCCIQALLSIHPKRPEITCGIIKPSYVSSFPCILICNSSFFKINYCCSLVAKWCQLTPLKVPGPLSTPKYLLSCGFTKLKDTQLSSCSYFSTSVKNS